MSGDSERPPLGRKIVRFVGSAWSGLSDNLVRIVAWLALLVLGWMLIESLRGENPDLGESLLILLAMAVAAAIAQIGNQVLGRLKRVGPVEFFEREVGDLLEPLRRFIPLGSKIEAGSPVGLEERYEYEKADLFVSTLEFTGVGDAELAGREDLHDLLHTIGSIATKVGDWPRAAERFDQLRRLSAGRYRPAEVAYNSGVNLMLWAEACEGEVRERLLRRALRRFVAATAADPSNHFAFYQLARVEDELGMFRRSVRHNESALHILPSFAPAKYNGAISTLKLGLEEEAYRRLAQLSPGDDLIGRTLAQARDDRELDRLRENPQLGPLLAELLESLGSARASRG